MKRYIISLIMFLITSVSICNVQEMVQIKGSDTLINLVQNLAENYMEKNPGKVIAVTGGGSGTGIAAMINGMCDIANASRTMKGKEVTQANEKGIDPKRIIIAVDGLSVITHSENPVNKLTVEQIGSIFRGEIANWKELDGQDMPITLYGRQSNSGTYVFFMDEVLKGDYSQNMRRMNGNAQILEALKQDKSGVGYIGVGYVRNAVGINVLKVAKTEGDDYISPLNSIDVKSGKYPIARALNQYTNGLPKGDVKSFIAFELSAEGQQIVEEQGFFLISAEYENMNKKSIGN